MKQLKDPKKLVFGIVTLIIIIIAGIVMIAVKGFNVELRYTANKKVALIIEQTVDINKIQEKVDEVLGRGKSIVETTGMFRDSVQIISKEITEEQKNSLVEKINELYPQEATTEGEKTKKLLDSSKITIEDVQNARIRDFLRPYIIPMVVTTLVILVYYAVRYNKLGIHKVILESGLTMVIAQLLLLSILAIVRFPMGSLTAPLILTVYVVSLIYTNANLMKKEKAKKLEK